MRAHHTHTGAGVDVASLLSKGIPDLLALVNQDPEGLGVQWEHVVTHIASDVASGLVAQKDAIGTVQSASTQLYASLQQFASATGNQDESKAIEAAVNLVSTNWTSSGASQVIQGLAKMGIAAGAEAATPLAADAAKQFTGSLLTKALGTVAGGLAASGVGAAVGAGISLLSGVFQGLFGSPPPPPYSIGACGLGSAPDIVVRYTWMWGDKSITDPIVEGGPGNPNWRTFPEPPQQPVKGDSAAVMTKKMLTIAQAAIGIGDGAWYKPQTRQSSALPGGYEFGPTQHSWKWGGSIEDATRGHMDTWYGCFTFTSGHHGDISTPGPFGSTITSPGDDTGKRPIDLAMYDNGSDGAGKGSPEVTVYETLARENGLGGFLPIPAGIPSLTGATLPVFRQFQAAFFKAWKQNREFGLNGLKQQADWKVLEHTILMWNKAHAPSPSLTLAQTPNASLPWPGDLPMPTTPTYEGWLLGRYNGKFSEISLTNNGDVILNMGAVHTVVPAKTTAPAGHKPVVRTVPAPKLNLHLLPPVKHIVAAPAPPPPSRTMLVDGVLLTGLMGLCFGGPIAGLIAASIGSLGFLKKYPRLR